MTTPLDLGLPPHFASYREGQLEVAADLVSGEERFPCLSAPTGAGKSLIALTAASLANARTLILTGTKGLQSQYVADFASMGLLEVKGQSNYRCVALDRQLRDFGRAGSTCDEGPCHVGVRCSLKEDGGCLYYDAQALAAESQVVVTNYAYWMTLGRHSDPEAIGKFDLLILDEAHTAPDWLSSFCAIKLNALDIERFLDLELPHVSEGVPVWAEWAKHAHKKSVLVAAEARAALAATKDKSDRYTLTQRLLRLTDISRGLNEISLAGRWKRAENGKVDVTMPGLRTDWIVESYQDGHETGAKFSPVWAHAYSESYLFRGIPKVILASATLSRDIIKYLGIPEEQHRFIEVPSSFDPKRRPLIYSPTVHVKRGMSDGEIRMWIAKMDKIIEARQDRKGIIHTWSYDRAKLVVERSRYRDLMLTHKSRDLREVVAQFKRADAPRILVSPSVWEGFDFPGDDCRYQIIMKLPFVDPNGPLMKARLRSDKEYMNYVTALAVIQMVGRGMRSESDQAETFLIDDNWRWFRKAAERHFPKWFKAAIRWEEKIRPPFPLAA